MNFFGHAVVASWHTANGEFVLGAMLPDFANMLELSIEPAAGTELARGVEFHHLTDRVFHDASTFRRLEHWARRFLAERGLAKGPRWAVAHVGIEILLDELFDADRKGRASFLRAVDPELTSARDARVAPARRVSAEVNLDHALTELRRRLGARSAQYATVSLESMLYRLTRTLERRPKLALKATDYPCLAEFFEVAQEQVRNCGSSLVRELEMGLNLRAPAPLG